MKIKVIDAPCGKGKTSFAIQMMNNAPDKNFVFCTPYLSEIDRIQNSVKKQIKSPCFKDGRKINGFNDLLMNGESIATTHSTFANSTEDTIDYIKTGHYTLILDEVIDVIEPYNTVCNDTVTKDDIRLLLEKGFIETDEYCCVHWVADSFGDTKYSTVESLAKKGTLFLIDDVFMMWEFPYTVFDAFDEVYILTYMFNGSVFKPYIECHKLDYHIFSVDRSENGTYEMVEYYSDIEDRKRYKALITIYDNKEANNYKNYKLSSSWFKKNKKNELKTLKGQLYNYFHNVTKAKAKDILWTCLEDQKKYLKGEGYTKTRLKLSSEEKSLPKDKKDQLEKQLDCFLPLTTRATNLYSDRSVLAYCYNCFPNPYIEKYFAIRNETNEKDGAVYCIDKDVYALSNLVQWIWRSRIRNGEPITVYIPSTRMRGLFIRWLDGDI